MMKKNTLAMLSAALLAVISGCSSVQYVGRKFDELPEGTPIFFSWEKSEVDPAQYMIVGHGMLTVPGNADRYEIEDKLTEAARERGADAVCVAASRRVYEGVYDLDEDELTFPEDGKNLETVMQEAPPPLPIADQKLGKPVVLQGEYHGQQQIKIRAVFWKKREIAEPLIQQQKALLESKVAGNWNGENDPDTPKKAPAPELPPLPKPETSAPALPENTQPAPGTASTTAESDIGKNPGAPLLQGPTSPTRPHFAVPPSDIVAMP